MPQADYLMVSELSLIMNDSSRSVLYAVAEEASVAEHLVKDENRTPVSLE